MQSHKEMTAIVLLFLISLFLMGKGFTGMFLIDYTGKQFYTSDTTCNSLKCCFYYKSDSGICGTEQECQKIFLDTKAEKPVVGEKITDNYIFDSSQDGNYFILGSFLFLLSLVGILFLVKKK